MEHKFECAGAKGRVITYMVTYRYSDVSLSRRSLMFSLFALKDLPGVDLIPVCSLGGSGWCTVYNPPSDHVLS